MAYKVTVPFPIYLVTRNAFCIEYTKGLILVILVINHFKSRIREFRKIFITIRTRIVSEKVVFDRDIVFSPTVFRGELETDEIVTYFVRGSIHVYSCLV